MKSLLTAFVLGLALAGISFAQGTKASAETRIAVVEFTPGANASGMTAEAKRHLQASIAFALTETDRFEVVDVRNTRAASQADLATINGSSTAAAMRVGKQLEVSYVLTGTVVESNTKGSAILKTRLVEVATGKVKYSGEITQLATSAMRSSGAAEMQLKVLKPAIQNLTATLSEVF